MTDHTLMYYIYSKISGCQWQCLCWWLLDQGDLYSMVTFEFLTYAFIYLNPVPLCKVGITRVWFCQLEIETFAHKSPRGSQCIQAM